MVALMQKIMAKTHKRRQMIQKLTQQTQVLSQLNLNQELKKFILVMRKIQFQ